MRVDENGVHHMETVEDVIMVLGVDAVTAQMILDQEAGKIGGDVVLVDEHGNVIPEPEGPTDEVRRPPAQ
jgi:hypothetical protein